MTMIKIFKVLITLALLALLAQPCYGALEDGVNAGFVTVAPTSDPEGVATVMDTKSRAGRFTAPEDGTVTEIGWYCDNATEEANFEVGLYSWDTGNDRPDNLLGSDKTNAKGTDAGWKRVSGLSIPIVNGIIYGIANQLDDTATQTDIDRTSVGGSRSGRKDSQTTLPDPSWGAGFTASATVLGIYAMYTPAAGGAPQVIIIGN